jgi:hypothetical protein
LRLNSVLTYLIDQYYFIAESHHKCCKAYKFIKKLSENAKTKRINQNKARK